MILCMAVLTNILGLIFGNALNRIANFFRNEPWNVVTLVPKLAFGILKPICFDIGLFLRKKALASKSPALNFLIYLGILCGIAGTLYLLFSF